MPDASAGGELIDPAGLGEAVSRLSSGARKAGNAAFFVLAMALEPGERVETVVQCRYRGADGAMALTDRRLLIANARQWQPDLTPVGLEAGLTVRGWQDERSAALVFGRDGHELVVDKIGDRAAAQQIAEAVRTRAV
jgi:hypothetical protein